MTSKGPETDKGAGRLAKLIASLKDQGVTDPAVLAARAKVQLVGDKTLGGPRAGQVEVTLTDGRVVSQLTKFPPGTKENPLTTDQVNDKARKLMAPVLGAVRTEAVIKFVNTLETQKSVRDLIALTTTRKRAR